MNDTEILQAFKKWLTTAEDTALGNAICADDDGRRLDALASFARQRAFEDARNQLESLGVKFDI